jgi:hypothetical protein
MDYEVLEVHIHAAMILKMLKRYGDQRFIAAPALNASAASAGPFTVMSWRAPPLSRRRFLCHCFK